MTALVMAAALLLGQADTLTVSVRVVDMSGSAAPGISVRLVGVKDCGHLNARIGFDRVQIAGVHGAIDFTIPGPGSYVVRSEAEASGFNDTSRCLHVDGGGEGVAFVELQLRPDPKDRVTLVEPSVPDRKPHPLVVADLDGVYAGPDGRLFTVDWKGDDAQIELGLPDGRILYLSRRTRWVFASSEGTVTFRIAKGRVTDLVFTPRTVTARKRPEQ